ncbi:MAG TPA: hypothetical protein VGB91_04365 [Rhizomicrobium sp.]
MTVKGETKARTGSLLVLSGPVGAGKTTVARELVALMPGPTAHVEGDKFWSFVVRPPADEPRLDRFRILMRSMSAAAIPFARAAVRPQGRIDDYAQYRDFYALFDGAGPHALSDDTAEAAALAVRIRDGVTSERFRLA